MASLTQFHLDTRIVRIHNTYGPRMRAGDVYGRVVTRFIDQALKNNAMTIFGDGSQTRSFTYVSDMIRGVIKACLLPELSGEIINLGSTNEIKIIDLAEIIKNLTNSQSKLEFLELPLDDPLRRCPDISKARNLLNWTPEIILIQGLNNTITWIKENTS